MITYADSSVLIAWFHPDDEFAGVVTPWVREQVTDFVWNPMLRAEVRHNLRKVRSAYARTAWNAYRAAESNRCLTFGRERLATCWSKPMNSARRTPPTCPPAPGISFTPPPRSTPGLPASPLATSSRRNWPPKAVWQK